MRAMFIGGFAFGFICLGIGVADAAQSSATEPVSRIASLAPHLTELTFVAGAGERIVGTVEYSNHPEAARKIPRIGDAFRVDAERLLAMSPDVVLAWDTGTPPQTIERIRELGLDVEIFSTQRIADVARELRRLGKLARTEQIADKAAARFESEVAALRAEYRSRPQVSVFLQINDRPLYTVNGKQIISEIAALCGGTNVFADLNELAPVISEEAVIAADPDVIVSTDDTVPDPAARWQRWKNMRAVRASTIFSLRSDDVARPTTRLIVGIRAMCHALDTARVKLKALPSSH